MPPTPPRGSRIGPLGPLGYDVVVCAAAEREGNTLNYVKETQHERLCLKPRPEFGSIWLKLRPEARVSIQLIGRGLPRAASSPQVSPLPPTQHVNLSGRVVILSGRICTAAPHTVGCDPFIESQLASHNSLYGFMGCKFGHEVVTSPSESMGNETRVLHRVDRCRARKGTEREIGNLLPNNRRQRRTCYALCLYPVSAAHTNGREQLEWFERLAY